MYIITVLLYFDSSPVLILSVHTLGYSNPTYVRSSSVLVPAWGGVLQVGIRALGFYLRYIQSVY